MGDYLMQMSENMKSFRVVKSSYKVILAILFCFIHTSLAGVEKTTANSKGKLAILALGTSLTVNYDWPSKLSLSLSDCLGKKVEIEVVARSGENSDDALRQFKSRKQLNADIVLVEFLANDADLIDGVDLKASRYNHEFLIKYIQNSIPDARVILMTMNPVYGIRGLIRYKLVDYNKTYKELADGVRVFVADIYPLWVQKLGHDTHRKMLPDGLHPDGLVAESLVVPAVGGMICR